MCLLHLPRTHHTWTSPIPQSSSWNFTWFINLLSPCPSPPVSLSKHSVSSMSLPDLFLFLFFLFLILSPHLPSHFNFIYICSYGFSPSCHSSRSVLCFQLWSLSWITDLNRSLSIAYLFMDGCQASHAQYIGKTVETSYLWDQRSEFKILTFNEMASRIFDFSFLITYCLVIPFHKHIYPPNYPTCLHYLTYLISLFPPSHHWSLFSTQCSE